MLFIYLYDLVLNVTVRCLLCIHKNRDLVIILSCWHNNPSVCALRQKDCRSGSCDLSGDSDLLVGQIISSTEEDVWRDRRMSVVKWQCGSNHTVTLKKKVELMRYFKLDNEITCHLHKFY